MSPVPPPAAGPPEVSLVLIQLFKGPLYNDAHAKLWDPLITNEAAINDYLGSLGLRVEMSESEGYAFLRTKSEEHTEAQLPRLIARHKLPFHVSLLLALLRKRLAEHDAKSAEARLVLSGEQIRDMLGHFLAATSNEARTDDMVKGYVNRVVDLGFLRRMRGDADQYEVRRILKAFVDGHWLSDFEIMLTKYLDSLANQGGADDA